MHRPIHQECNPQRFSELVEQHGLHTGRNHGLPQHSSGDISTSQKTCESMVQYIQIMQRAKFDYIRMKNRKSIYIYIESKQRYFTSKLTWIYLCGFQTRPSLESPLAPCILILDSCRTIPNSCLESSSVEPPTSPPVGFTEFR